MQKHFPTRTIGRAFCINSTHHALNTKLGGNFINELRPFYCRRIHTDLVGSGTQNSSSIFQRTNSTTHCERDKHFRRCALHYVNHGVAIVRRSCDIEKHQLVGALLVGVGIVGFFMWDAHKSGASAPKPAITVNVKKD